MTSLHFHNNTREAAFAGCFYPGAKNELQKQLDELFREAGENSVSPAKLRAIIAPHAGYVFSGKVAASAFNQIPTGINYKRVFVLASSHSYRFGGAAVYGTANYQTPLGKIKVDKKVAEKLIQSSPVFMNKPEAHENEHSLEVQLPFLQHKLGNGFLLVPIIIGTDKPEVAKEIAHQLEPFFTPENLFVISTDFSHYPTFKDAETVDAKTADAICRNNPDVLLDTLEENKAQNIENLATSLCGWTSVLTLLYLTRNKKFRFREIDYQNSGHASGFGEKNKVVGYWAIAVHEDLAEEPFKLNKEEQSELLLLAKEAIGTKLSGGKPSATGHLKKGILGSPAGAFVSVYVKGELRGCIGNFGSTGKTLGEVVQKSAISAINDSRFRPLHKDEQKDMELEISVLSPLKKIESVSEIELGRHGIYIKKGLHSGTFLPQVASKTGWALDEFLGRCSRDKAGLSWDGWKKADLFTYEAFVFRG